jgi:hypothetical protein
MTLKQKLKEMVRIKNLIIFCLILLLIWWAGAAILKYWSQPLTTDTMSVFGDNEKGIKFPLITICDHDFTKNPLMKNCCTNRYDFISSFFSCMKEDSNLLIESFMDSIQLDIRKIVSMVSVWTGSAEYISLQNLDGHAWSGIFDHMWGFCHTFDLSKINKFKYVPYKRLRPGLKFVMAENNPWQRIAIMFHTKNDLPDAFILNGFQSVTFSNTTKQVHKFDLKKKTNRRETTRKVPCSQYEYNTCQNSEDNQLILDNFHCRIPILYSGQHLDDLIPKEVLNCSHDVTMEALAFIMEKESKCEQSITCEMTRYTSIYEVGETWQENKSLIWVAFKNPEVEFHNTYVNYNLISLVGEVGGILGLTLGASTLTLLELIFQHLRYY